MAYFRLKQVLCMSLLAFLPANTFAVDGVVLIDQSRALAGNVTPGDAPGFPVTITQRGSYRLSGNLTVSDIDTTAIDIRSSFVTFDLNGFSIIGPVDCSGATCPRGAGSGIAVGDHSSQPPRIYFNIVIRNGTIQGMGGDGIFLFGDTITVEDMTVRSNGRHGLYSFRAGVSSDQGSVRVQKSHAALNGLGGISVESGVVIGNTASYNWATGIFLRRGLVLQNVTQLNQGNGMFLGLYVGAAENASQDNVGGPDMSGGIPLGKNLCKDNSC